MKTSILASSLLLAACGQPVSDNLAVPPVETTATPAPAPPSPAPSPTPVTDTGAPTLTPEAERGETGARNVLLEFARSIERQDFAAARALLSNGDRAKWSADAFAGMFAGMGTITVAVPTGTMEGAAGSSYYTAPVTITGDAPNARTIRGEAVLRRVNDVDGATPAQLRWHFDRLTLDQ